VIGAPAARGDANVQPHTAAIGEFEGIRQQVLQHLQQALGIGRDGTAQPTIEIGRERETADGIKHPSPPGAFHQKSARGGD
jgi:hypothetical protein